MKRESGVEKMLSGNYKTDKFDLGYISHIYNNLFQDRYTPKKVLEIGVLYGGSLLLWRDWFVNAEITGIDLIDCPSLRNEERITVKVGNAYSELADTLPNDFDIIIDDGPHTLDSWLFFISKYTHKLNKGGILVLEDIIDLSVMDLLINTIPKNLDFVVYEMAGKQLTESLLAKWKNGLNILVVKS